MMLQDRKKYLKFGNKELLFIQPWQVKVQNADMESSTKSQNIGCSCKPHPV